ncbi:2,3-bisphosphoglycerate-dependent phosphoglycerate mutase [Streptomyces alboniger]
MQPELLGDVVELLLGVRAGDPDEPVRGPGLGKGVGQVLGPPSGARLGRWRSRRSQCVFSRRPRAATCRRMPTLDGMPTLILVRHGRSTANTEGLLAGWTPGVALDERGATQAAALPGRLAELPLSEVVSSPLQRCQETIRPLLDVRPGLTAHTDERIGECHYGDWSNRKLAELSGAADGGRAGTDRRPRSPAVSRCGRCRPVPPRRCASGTRAWSAITSDAVYPMCSHGDVIKSLVADALALSSRPLPADFCRTVFHHRDPLHPSEAVSRPSRRHR